MQIISRNKFNFFREVSVTEIHEEETTNTEKQILASAEQLDKFITDGNKVVNKKIELIKINFFKNIY